MASFSKRKDGKWRASVDRRGVRRSKVLPTKQAAKDWAALQEHLILDGDGAGSRLTFGEVMDRYAREFSVKKRGARWEILRLEKFQRDDIASIKVVDLRASDLADWRDARLGQVAPGSVHREMTLLSAVLSVARREWGLIKSNPLADVRKPSKPPPRDRLPTPDEFERLALSAGDDLASATGRAFHAFLFACETGMRAGEIVGLEWLRVDLDRRVAHLPITKNGSSRDVPLSSEAIRLLGLLPRLNPVFDIDARSLDRLWRKVRDRAGVVGLTFHDSRAYAATMLSKKVDVLTLARILGHKDLRMLQVYYRESAADIAKRLD